MSYRAEFEERARKYAESSKISIDLSTPLGEGTDGIVYRSMCPSAVKVLQRQRNYILELECYQRLSDHNVDKLVDFSVPKLIKWDDDLMIIEIGIVSPPFIVDFGKVRLDSSPDFSPEVVEDWDAMMVDLFGERLPKVRVLLAALEKYGIYYTDPKPGNIVFDRQSTSDQP